MCNHLFNNDEYQKTIAGKPCKVDQLLKVYPEAIGLRGVYINNKTFTGRTIGKLPSWAYLLTDITIEDVTILALHGIHLIKLSDDAHMFTVVTVSSIEHAIYNIPVELIG